MWLTRKKMKQIFVIFILIFSTAISAEEINLDFDMLASFDVSQPIDVCQCDEISDLTSTVIPALEGIYRNHVIINGSDEEVERGLIQLSKLQLLHQIERHADSGFALGTCSESEETNELVTKIKEDYGIESEIILPMLNPPALNPKILHFIVDQKRILIYRGEINGNEVVFFLDSDVDGTPRLRYLEQELPGPQYGIGSKTIGNKIVYTDLATGEEFGHINQSGNRLNLSFGQETDNGDQLELKGNLSGITPEGEQQQDVDAETSLTYTTETNAGDLQFGLEAESELDADAPSNGTQTYQGQGTGFVGYKYSSDSLNLDHRQDVASTTGTLHSQTNASASYDFTDHIELTSNAKLKDYRLVGEQLGANYDQDKTEIGTTLDFNNTVFEEGNTGLSQGLGEETTVSADYQWDQHNIHTSEYGLTTKLDEDTKVNSEITFEEGMFDHYDFSLINDINQEQTQKIHLHGNDLMPVTRLTYVLESDKSENGRNYTYTNRFDLEKEEVQFQLEQGEYGDSDRYGLELSQQSGTTFDYGQTRTIAEGTITGNDIRINDEFLTIGSGLSRERTWGDRTDHFGCQVSMTAISEYSTASPSRPNVLRNPGTFSHGSSTTCGLDVAIRGFQVESTTARISRDYRVGDSANISMYMEADALYSSDFDNRILDRVGFGLSGQIKF